MKFNIFDKFNSVKHLVSEKDHGSHCQFSMALHTGEEKRYIIENRKVLESFFGKEYRYATLLQIHSDRIHIVKSREDLGWSGIENTIEADALITNLPNMVLTILTADCVPILLFDPVKSAIGAVHAGWKGTQHSIVVKTVDMMQREYGSNPKDIIAAIGPSIGGCCYEVGDDVADNFTEYQGGAMTEAGDGKYFLDLKSINADQLIKAGLNSSNIETTPICTSCQSNKFFSYRKEQGCSGRFISAISI